MSCKETHHSCDEFLPPPECQIKKTLRILVIFGPQIKVRISIVNAIPTINNLIIDDVGVNLQY